MLEIHPFATEPLTMVIGGKVTEIRIPHPSKCKHCPSCPSFCPMIFIHESNPILSIQLKASWNDTNRKRAWFLSKNSCFGETPKKLIQHLSCIQKFISYDLSICEPSKTKNNRPRGNKRFFSAPSTVEPDVSAGPLFFVCFFIEEFLRHSTLIFLSVFFSKTQFLPGRSHQIIWALYF